MIAAFGWATKTMRLFSSCIRAAQCFVSVLRVAIVGWYEKCRQKESEDQMANDGNFDATLCLCLHQNNQSSIVGKGNQLSEDNQAHFSDFQDG